MVTTGALYYSGVFFPKSIFLQNRRDFHKVYVCDFLSFFNGKGKIFWYQIDLQQILHHCVLLLLSICLTLMVVNSI